jgi:Flp pilus assembly protein TadB
MRKIAAVCAYFPRIGLKSRCSKGLISLGIDPQKYVSMSLFLSGCLSMTSLVVLMVLGIGPAFPLALLCFALCFGFFLVLPRMELGKRSAEVEAEMPFFLRSVGMLLDMGIPFQRAVEIASDSEGTLQQEMRSVMDEVERGMGVQRAFASFALSMNSFVVKRAVSQLISAYEIGSSGSEMRKIGDELLSLEQHRLKEYSARSAMFGLFFIISSAILPTFFLVYAIAGKFAVGQEITTSQVALALLVFFPLTSVLILLLSKSTMPQSAFSGPSGFDARLLLPGLIFTIGFLFLPQLQAAVSVMSILLGAYFIFSNYNSERRIEEIESMLPDALFSVGGLPKSTSPERIFEIIENGGHGALSEEAGKSRSQLGMNLKVDSVLDDLWQRNHSGILRRVCGMIRQMINTNSLDNLNMLAEDIIRSFQIKRERSQIFALQKYTLVFGAFLTALILKMTLHLFQDMGGLVEGSKDMISSAMSVVPPYLVIYSTVSAAAIADAEGKKSSLAIYFLVLAALGLGAFHFITL